MEEAINYLYRQNKHNSLVKFKKKICKDHRNKKSGLCVVALSGLLILSLVVLIAFFTFLATVLF